MVGIRTVAALVSLGTSLYGMAVAGYWDSIVHLAVGIAGPNIILVTAGVILLLDSVVCFFGFTNAFYVSAVLSAVIILLEVAQSIPLAGTAFVVGAILCVVTIGLDILGARRKSVVSEENHPLNLPVFG